MDLSGGPNGNNETEKADYQVAASVSHQKQSIADLEVNWKDVPDKYFIIIANFLAGRINDSKVIDHLNGPILKSSVDSTYWIFLIQYAALSMLGIVMNLAIIAYIMYYRFYKDVTNAFIVNLALCHFVQCAVVLPITLMVMIIQNWIFGQFLCFFLPMLQDIPLHVAMISHILIAWDRMRWLGDPMKGRFPAFVCCCATWLTGMVIALPYPIYMIYVEIGDYVPSLNGIGLCVVNLMDDMHEYMRGLFLIMYCAPTVLLAYLYVKTSQELRPPEGPVAVMMFEHRAGVRNRQQRNSSASSVDRSCSAGGGTITTTTSGIGTLTTHSGNGHHSSSASAAKSSKSPKTTSTGAMLSAATTRSYDLYNAELDVYREKRKQRNFGSMAAAQVVCLCPLMVLRFARLSMEETYENQKHIDFTYLMFVWIAFLPTVIFPCIYASQILPRAEQERLRGYFRLSSKRLKISRNPGGGGAIVGATSGKGDTASSRKSSIEKDENTNTTQVTSIISYSEDYVGGDPHTTTMRHELKSAGKYASHSEHQHSGNALSGAGTSGRQGKLAGKNRHHHSTVAAGEGARIKKSNAKVNIVSSDEKQPHKQTSKGEVSRTKKSANSSAMRKSSSNNASSLVYPNPNPNPQRKLTLESIDVSCSNVTSSTYCNGNSVYLDDGGTSNFGDGEDSSIAGGVVMQGGRGSACVGGYYDKKWNASGQPMRRNDMSLSDCDTMSRMDSSSTLARDLEIIDMLERERSINIQEMIEREKHGEVVRPAGERRRLPDIEKIYQLSPQIKHDPYSFDQSATASTASASTMTRQDTHSHSHTLSTSIPTDSDPLQDHHEAYSAASTLAEEGLNRSSFPHGTDNRDAFLYGEDDEEVPPDFFDHYTPGGDDTLPATSAAPLYQYQYSRRLSRNSSHHSQGSNSHHRSSKRDSFNSLNGTDLIAGAFGELDPTQPLTKMSVIESRMRRSSGRTSSFSSSGRSSLKSRDYSHGSTHSAHPELDFRENIFAEL